MITTGLSTEELMCLLEALVTANNISHHESFVSAIEHVADTMAHRALRDGKGEMTRASLCASTLTLGTDMKTILSALEEERKTSYAFDEEDDGYHD